MIWRLFRLVFVAGLAAGAVAAYRALTRKDDPLPTAPDGPRSEPWPPLRNESPAPDEIPDTPTPTETTSAGDSYGTTVVPEPGGVPVAPAGGADTAWVEPVGDGDCPEGYPVKANMRSKIFHSPGQLNYDRTSPDRCYVDAAAAEADGLRAAKR